MLLHRISILVVVALCLCALLLSTVVFPRPAFAAGDPIRVTSQTDTVHFPNFIDFDLSANDSSGTLSQAIISITFSIPGYENQEDQHTLTISYPAQSVTLHWREDTTGNNFYPAGVLVAYNWQLEDSAGHRHTGVTQHFSTIDTRFNWQRLTQGNLQVNWYNRSQDFGQLVLDKASASLARISTMLGSRLVHPINVWIYASVDDFHGSLQPNSYEWVGGEALPSLDEASIVVVDTSDLTLVRDMPHELTHLLFHQLINPEVRIPTWFDEGLAVYNQIYHEPEMTARLQAALDLHTLLRLDDIADGFPSNSDQAYLAYAQSWNLVSYMYSTFGLNKMTVFIKLLKNLQATFTQDLQQALGEDQTHLEDQWRIHLHQPPALAPGQLTPTAQPQGQPVLPKTQTNANSSSPLLITFGFLLVLASLIMLLLISVNVNRRKQQALEMESAQQLVAVNTQRWQPDNQTSSYTQTSTYMQSPIPPSTPFVPANPHASSWEWDYPDDEGQANAGEDQSKSLMGPSSLPFIESQEYLGQRPRRQVPQE